MFRIDNITKLKIKKWIYSNPIWNFFYVYVGTIFTIIHLLIKYRFDFDVINVQIDHKRQDAKYKLEKETLRNIELNKKLEEFKKINEEIRSKRYENLS